MNWVRSLVILVVAAVVAATPTDSVFAQCTIGAGDRCVLPGVTVACDPAGDFTPDLGSAQDDILQISFAEPVAGPGPSPNLVVTIRVAELKPDSLPLSHVWRAFFVGPNDGVTYFVSMLTCDLTSIPSFDYGFIDQNGVMSSQGEANDGEVFADGTIRITIDKALVGGPGPGQVLTGIAGETRLFVGIQCNGNTQLIDTADLVGEYTMIGTCPNQPPPVFESRCIEPGLTVTTDPAGDVATPQGDAASDLVSVSIAEPHYPDGVERVVFTIRNVDLDPTSIPLSRIWRVFFIDPTDTDTTFFASMNTCRAQLGPAFDFGYIDAVANNLQRGLGTADSGMVLPNGDIRIVMRKKVVGSFATTSVLWHMPVGEFITGVSGTNYLLVGANCSGSIQVLDAAGVAGGYEVEGNAYCTPFAVTCPPDFTGSEGDHSLDFVVNNPSTAAREFVLNLSDDEGWLLGGASSDTLVVGPASSATHSAVLRTEGCNPPVTDGVHWMVTAADLPLSARLRECTTAAACTTVVTGVGNDPQGLDFSVIGANPFRGGSTLLGYTVPERGPVRIEIFSVTGQRVRRLVDGVAEAGTHTVRFQLKGGQRPTLGPGVYLARFVAGEQVRTLRLVALE